MYINALYDADLQNGRGVGVTLCVSGCPIKCQGCFNPEAQNPQFGQEYTQKNEEQIISLLGKEYIDHFAIIGGEPLTQDKIRELAWLCRHIKQLYPQKKIWLWSGYTCKRKFGFGLVIRGKKFIRLLMTMKCIGSLKTNGGTIATNIIYPNYWKILMFL